MPDLIYDDELVAQEPKANAITELEAERESATAEEAVAALTAVRSAAPNPDDWSAKRTDNPKGKKGLISSDKTARDPAIQILLRPNIPRPTKRLGGTYRQGYEVRGVPAGQTVRWLHSVNGKYEGGKAGTSSSVNAPIVAAGETPLRSTVTIERRDGSLRQEEAPEVTVIAPRTNTDIVSLWSRMSGRAKDLPVKDHFHPDEELVVVVRLPYVDEDVEHAHAEFHGNLKVKEVVYRGPQKFEAVLQSNGKGPVSGSLIVAPKNVDFLHSRATTLPALLIENRAPSSPEYGNRPSDPADAASRISRHIAALYERRRAAIGTLMGTLSYKDPPPPDPAWKRGLKALGRTAIDAAAAALGERVKSALSASEHAKEAVKVFIESVQSKLLNEAIDQAFEDEDPKLVVRPGDGGVLLRLPENFREIQQGALSKIATKHGDVAETSAKALVARLERSKEGSGYLAALELAETIDAQVQPAWTEQYHASLHAWSAMLAQLRLGTVGEGGKHGTDLMSQVQVSRIVDDPKTKPVESGSLDATKGVIRMELGLREPNTKNLYVVRSFVDGFDNDTVVDAFSKTPVKDLKVPMVARFNASNEDAFVIGRNETGSYYADSQGMSIYRWSTAAKKREVGPVAKIDAAETIFEKHIGPTHIHPKRG